VPEKKHRGLLRSMGVEKIHTLQEMPVKLLEKVLGEPGIVLWKKANGIDNNPVEPYNERKSISTEETFDSDTIDMCLPLKALIVKMVEKLAYQLRSENKLTACITVKIRYSNFDTHTTQCRIPYTSNDQTLIEEQKNSSTNCMNAGCWCDLMGIRFSHLVGGGHQINLFEDSEEIINLYQAMDKMRLKFGDGAIQRAIGTGLNLRKFNPFNGLKS
jgi:DNA polymerase-4